MDKEEIEKAKEDLSFINEGDYITREMSNSKDILIKYIEHLEILNETYKTMYAMSDRSNKELEQKESILDKVTDLAYKIATENAEKYNPENQKEVDFSEWNLAIEILNIIEGEKSNAK